MRMTEENMIKMLEQANKKLEDSGKTTEEIKAIQLKRRKKVEDEIERYATSVGTRKAIIAVLFDMWEKYRAKEVKLPEDDPALERSKEYLFSTTSRIIHDIHISDIKDKIFQTAFLRLPEDESNVLNHLYGIEDDDMLPIADVSKLLGIGKRRVKQLKKNGLDALFLFMAQIYRKGHKKESTYSVASEVQQ